MKWAILNGWDEARTMYAFRLAMRGEAENWMNSVPQCDSLEDLLGKFRERFIGKTLVLTIIKEMARMEYDGGNTILGFLDKMAGLARRAKLPEDVLVALSLNAIPEKMAKLILLNSQGGLTWHNMYQSCGNLRSCKDNVKVMAINEGNSNDWKKQKRKRSLTCLLCGKPGHVVRTCNYNALNKRMSSEYKPGNSSECNAVTDDPANENKEIFEYSFVNIINTCHTTIISVNGNNIEALVDSGSMTNIIRAGYVVDKEIRPTKTRLRSAEGAYMKTVGECVKNIGVNEKKIRTRFVVCEGLEAKCILGMPFLKDNEVTMRFGKECSMEIGSGEKPALGYHRVITTVDKPVMTPLYKLGLQAENEASKIIEGYMKDKIIRPRIAPGVALL
ncbi:hypothetical protein NGRA_2758 [Nosema granulosis]|uniref:CCHC-type domain-containing protein n=1 Tax=Nosema granulosis TaxID=83296 RepID=A0A9P6KXE2_9MICR|nr:hypothetical protein NGRA_2758 [Nosema granulosis]